MTLPTAFTDYVEDVERIAQAILCGRPAPAKRLASELNGQVSTRLRELVPLEERREIGAFFTGSRLRKRLVDWIGPSEWCSVRLIFDPACGAGDLLIAAASRLPVCSTLDATLSLWTTLIGGRDTEDWFIRLCRARLVLLAHRLTGRVAHQRLELSRQFAFVNTGDGKSSLSTLPPRTILLVNPPYGVTPSPHDCDWASGGVSEAALFVDTVVQSAPRPSTIVALLPDVLRSGSRYAKWRNQIEAHTNIVRVRPFGRFDLWTDIDVFALQARLTSEHGSTGAEWFSKPRDTALTVGKLFDVGTGPVVPGRHADTGPPYRYIHARLLPRRGDYATVDERRGFTGPLFHPPFVAVRRTSRPGEPVRARATLVTGVGPVAVENHLLVLTPTKGGGVTRCRQLVRLLSQSSTSRWLDQRLRCHHLTVQAIRDITWSEM